MSDERSPPAAREQYVQFLPIGTRWADNDLYGHVNNVVYYAWFDTAVNRILTGHGLDIHAGPIIGLCVESGCRYHAPLAYPEDVEVGVRVAKVGRSSVRYELGVFRVGEARASGATGEPTAAAEGFFVHVFVDRQTRRPSALPETLATALRSLVR